MPATQNGEAGRVRAESGTGSVPPWHGALLKQWQRGHP